MTDHLKRIRNALKEYEGRPLEAPLRERLTASAVLAPLYEAEGDVHLLFTLRSSKVHDHKGQISFPGGKREEGETSLECALRETEEEIGIHPQDVDIIGKLDEVPVISNHVITPYVGIVPYPHTLTVNPDEIERVIPLPLEGFFDPAIYHLQLTPFMGRNVPVHFFRFPEATVWGATARIVVKLLSTAYGFLPEPYREVLEREKREHKAARG